MPKRTFRIREGEPLFDLVAYGRGGPGLAGGRLTPAQVEQIRRTVQRTPEAVVKVLPRGSNDLKAVGKHLDYVGRHGELDLETDDGERVSGRIGKELLDDWDLDIDAVRRQGSLSARTDRKPPKLVHKLMFSMPPGTPPEKVLGAVRNFAREEFWGQHRYTFVLHTDEAHPHVHLVLKAISERGVRLNIRKATLRHWRSEFARNLRLLGVEANATERAVRGEIRNAKKDGIYRASQRGDSTYVRARAEAVTAELMKGNLHAGPGKFKLVDTRTDVEHGWRWVSDILVREGQRELAAQVTHFVEQMPQPRTEREQIGLAILEGIQKQRARDRSQAAR
jgi:hypothetical protein